MRKESKEWVYYRCKWCKACICEACFLHILQKADGGWIHVPDCADMPKESHEGYPVMVKKERPGG